MISPVDVIASVFPVYLLILAGAILRWMRIIRREHDEGIMRVVYSVMLLSKIALPPSPRAITC